MVLWLIRKYQKSGGGNKLLMTDCNFEPTCSQYCFEAIEKYGLLTGLKLGLKRIGRCTDPDLPERITDRLT